MMTVSDGKDLCSAGSLEMQSNGGAPPVTGTTGAGKTPVEKRDDDLDSQPTPMTPSDAGRIIPNPRHVLVDHIRQSLLAAIEIIVSIKL